jgi:hypothetical protein
VDDSPTTKALKVQLGIPPETTLYKSVGCRECRNTGFLPPRHFQWMDSDNEIRQLVLRNASSDQVRDAARRAGMKTLAEDGWRLVRLGVTTVDEVLGVTTAKEVSLSDGSIARSSKRKRAAQHCVEKTMKPRPSTLDPRPSTSPVARSLVIGHWRLEVGCFPN